MTLNENFLTEPQVAQLLGVKVETLRNWHAKRQGPPRIKVGRNSMYRGQSLISWLEGREVAPALSNNRGRRPHAKAA